MRRMWLGGVLFWALSVGVAGSAEGRVVARTGRGRVEIVRTAFGIPHIRANTAFALGFGVGYAQAQDSICTLANMFVTVAGERSRWFGPTQRVANPASLSSASNLDSDLYYTELRQSGAAQHLYGRGINAESRSIAQDAEGFVAGYNRYLRDIGGPSGIRDPACHGARWVRPITVADTARVGLDAILLGSSDPFIDAIASAQPPAAASAAFRPLAPAGVSPFGAAAAAAEHLSIMGNVGSNGIAVGSAAMRGGRGAMLFANPHLPWAGGDRMYQMQTTLTGSFDATGGTLLGSGVLGIATNRWVAYTSTDTSALHFVPYQLTLVRGDPTAYLVDGHPVRMSRRRVSVLVKTGHGLAHVTRTLYGTRWGPVFTGIHGLLPLPWTSSTAYALHTPGVEDGRLGTLLWDLLSARSTHQVISLAARFDAQPFAQFIVADRHGTVGYSDASVIPDITNALAARCNTSLGRALLAQYGLPILDGSRSACAPGSDPDSPVPGVFGGRELPHQIRHDYELNSNDSYWMTNASAPMHGYPRIVGDDRAALTLRTREALADTIARIHGTDGLGAPGFSPGGMRDIFYSDSSQAAHLALGSVRGLCHQDQQQGYAVSHTGSKVPLGDACAVLAGWDGANNPSSRGALLFRHYWEHVTGVAGEPLPAHLWRVPFNPLDPVNTPRTLNLADPVVRSALADAILDLRKGGVALDAPLAAYQHVRGQHGASIAIPGGMGDPEGVLNTLYTTSEDTYAKSSLDEPYLPVLGSSYVAISTWGKGACPIVDTVLTYGESTDPTRFDWRDQTAALYAKRRLIREPFCAADVNRQAVSRRVFHLG